MGLFSPDCTQTLRGQSPQPATASPAQLSLTHGLGEGAPLPPASPAALCDPLLAGFIFLPYNYFFFPQDFPLMLQCLLLPQSFCWHRNGFPSLWALPLATITISVMPPLKSFFWGSQNLPKPANVQKPKPHPCQGKQNTDFATLLGLPHHAARQPASQTPSGIKFNNV